MVAGGRQDGRVRVAKRSEAAAAAGKTLWLLQGCAQPSPCTQPAHGTWKKVTMHLVRAPPPIKCCRILLTMAHLPENFIDGAVHFCLHVSRRFLKDRAHREHMYTMPMIVAGTSRNKASCSAV